MRKMLIRSNEYLGAGTWEEWHTLDADGQIALGRRKKLDRALWSFDKSLAVLSPYDTDYVEKARNDLLVGFDLLLASKFPDPDQFRRLLRIYEKSIDTADCLMDEAEAIPVVGLILGASSMKTVGLAHSAKQLREQLLKLDELLRQAQFEKIEAQIQQAFGIVSGTIGLVVPGLSLISKGGLTVADLLLDDQLGPDKPEPMSIAGDSAKGINYVLDVMQEVKANSARTKTIAGKAGKVLTVSGFYFDAHEVVIANKNIDTIKTDMDKCKKLHDDLIGKLNKTIPVLERVQQRMNNLVRPLREKARNLRWERDDLIKHAGYPVIKPLQWKIVQDWSGALGAGLR